MIIETQDKRRYQIRPLDRLMTAGVVIEEGGDKVVLGWSRDEDEDIQVLEMEGKSVWRGTGLQETLTAALEDLRQRSN